MTNYTYLHVLPDSLDNGRPLAFGDEVTLDDKQESNNSRLIHSGALVEVVQPQTKSPAKKKNETEEVSN